MAYISKEQVKAIREQLKKELPSVKFSVICRDNSVLDVAIMSSMVNFGTDYQQVNTYWIAKNWENNIAAKELLEKVNKIATANRVDNSDAMSDYFDVNYYFNLNIGRYDKPYKITA